MSKNHNILFSILNNGSMPDKNDPFVKYLIETYEKELLARMICACLSKLKKFEANGKK